MKILFCHNYYRFRGGEDLSFEAEVDLLRREGHQVIPLTRYNRDLSTGLLGRIRAGTHVLYNPETRREAESLIQQFKPDILHCNNLFPQISYSVYRAASRHGIPIVQALRNYRRLCANGLLMRQSKVCLKCLEQPNSLAPVRYGCYHDSPMASAVVTLSERWQRRLERVRPLVDAYIVPSQFARELFIRGNIEPDRLYVKPNFVHPDPKPQFSKQHHALYVGRLSEEKGIHQIIQAWRDHGVEMPLRIFGDGPLRPEVESLASQSDRVHFGGHIPLSDVIAESFACATPVIATELGVMLEHIDPGRNGLLVPPGDSMALANAVREFSRQTRWEQESMNQHARRCYEERFTSDQNYRRLMEIYQAARQRHAGRRDSAPSTDMKSQGMSP